MGVTTLDHIVDDPVRQNVGFLWLNTAWSSPYKIFQAVHIFTDVYILKPEKGRYGIKKKTHNLDSSTR